MEDRTRNILIGIIVLFGVMGAGSAIILPYLSPEAERAGTGVAERARGRRLMGEGKFVEARSVFLQVIQQHPGTQVAARAQADNEHGIPYHQALRMAQAGQIAQARAMLDRVAREGANTEWGPKARDELNRLGQGGPVAGGTTPAAPPGGVAPAAPAPQAAQEQARQDRLAQANSLLEQGRTEDARVILQALVNEGVDDQVDAAARLQVSALQAVGQAVRSDPEVGRARVALHRARASLLGYRGANGQYPSSLQDRGLEQFGFSYRDLLADVRQVESYRAEAGSRFELIAVARDARGTRVRATDRAVEDLP